MEGAPCEEERGVRELAAERMERGVRARAAMVSAANGGGWEEEEQAVRRKEESRESIQVLKIFIR